MRREKPTTSLTRYVTDFGIFVPENIALARIAKLEATIAERDTRIKELEVALEEIVESSVSCSGDVWDMRYIARKALEDE